MRWDQMNNPPGLKKRIHRKRLRDGESPDSDCVGGTCIAGVVALAKSCSN
jgi:hypothetical protein